MTAPVSVRLDDDVREILETEARARQFRPTASRITEDQLLAIRRQVGLAIGLGDR